MITVIVLAINNNIAVAIAVVAIFLLLVKFQIPRKKPIDQTYVLWAITFGISCGANFFLIAVISSLLITFVLLFFSSEKALYPIKRLDERRLVIHFPLLYQSPSTIRLQRILGHLVEELHLRHCIEYPSYLEIALDICLKPSHERNVFMVLRRLGAVKIAIFPPYDSSHN